MSAAPFPEVREGEAGPEVAAIYAGLRAAMGIPVVNLIWRHFATMPGVLEWCWATARPALAERGVAEGRAAMAALAPAGAAIPEFGLPEAERARLAAVLATYNRGNRTNLQVLTALRLAISGEGCGGGAPDPVPPPAPLPALPPQPALAALEGPARAAVERLAGLHGHGGAAVPSLYLHLALWPQLLPPLADALAPRFASGEVARLRGALLEEGARRARALLPVLAPPGPFPGAHRAPVLEVLALFPGKLIAEMTAVGLLLGGKG